MFVNANSDPKKSSPCKPSDFFFFQINEDRGFTADAAQTFFSLAAEQKLPSWVLPHMPLKELGQARQGKNGRSLFPRAWVGDNVFVIGPKVKGDLIKFEFALVTSLATGEVTLTDLDTGYEVLADIPEQPHENTIIVDGEFKLLGD